MISKDKTYRTRDGREVRIYATDGRGDYQVHGAIQTVTGWEAHIWFKDGKSIFQDEKERPADLFEVKPRHKRTVWINVYDDKPFYGIFHTRGDADTLFSRCRIACIKVDLDFEEGEGLTHPTYSVSSGGSPPFDNGGGFTPTTWTKITEEGL